MKRPDHPSLALALAIVAAAASPVPLGAAEPLITVSPYVHKHVYESGASGYTWYAGHLKAADNKNDVLRWLFQDLNMDYIRNGFSGDEPTNDNSDPELLDPAGITFGDPNGGNEWVYQQAKPLNPRLKTISYAHSFPDWLRKSDGTPTYASNFYAEYAEWLYANLANKKAIGVPCDILDIYNEGDYQGFGRDHVGNLLEHAIPLLRARINDPARNPSGVLMPRIMAPSCLSANESRNWLRHWYFNEAAVWDQIDIAATHQYGGGFDYWNYTDVNGVRGGRPFMQSEMHCGHSASMNNPNQLPEDWVEDELEAACSLGRLFSVSVNNGVSVYDYYMGVSPQDSPTSLVHTPYGQNATRRKVYFAFKQLSSMQTRGSHVAGTSIADGEEGYDAIAYHHWGESKTWLTVTCSQNTAQYINLKLLDKKGQVIPMQQIRVYETSATRDAGVVETLDFSTPVTTHRTWLPKHCLRTYEITWAAENRLLAADDWQDPAFMAGGSGWSGGWGRSGSPLPFPRVFNKNTAPRFQGSSNGSSIRRTLATPLTGEGLMRFKWDADSLDAGESVVAEVYDGEWRTVWTVTNASNGTDDDGDFDAPKAEAFMLTGFAPITQVRFRMLANTSGDYFHLDDLELIEFPSAVSSFSTWSSAAGIPGAGFDADHDGDGLPEGLEWALGGDPVATDASQVLIMDADSATGISFTFHRPAAAGHVPVYLEWATHPGGPWTSQLIAAAGTVNGVTTTLNGDEVTVTVSSEHAADGTLFARLRATPP